MERQTGENGEKLCAVKVDCGWQAVHTESGHGFNQQPVEHDWKWGSDPIRYLEHLFYINTSRVFVWTFGHSLAATFSSPVR